MQRVFKIQLFSGVINRQEARDWCIQNNYFAISYTKKDGELIIDEKNDLVKKYKDSKNICAKTAIRYMTGEFTELNNESCIPIKENDLIWTLDKESGFYYVGVVRDNKCSFRNEMDIPDNFKNDISLVRNCEWCTTPIKRDEVPGCIVYNRQGTLSMVHPLERTGIKYKQLADYSKYLFDKEKNKFAITDFWSFLEPDDHENILGIYLQKGYTDDKGITKFYYVIPKTAKVDTAKIEYMLTSEAGESVGVQCKLTDGKLKKEDFDNYSQYDKFFYSQPSPSKENNHSNVIHITFDELQDFAFKNYKIMPQKVKNIITLMNE